MNEQQTLEKLVRIETNVEAMTQALKRMADQHDTRLDDHDTRLRALELAHANHPTRTDFQQLRDFMMKAVGVLAVVSSLGLPTVAYIIISIGSK